MKEITDGKKRKLEFRRLVRMLQDIGITRKTIAECMGLSLERLNSLLYRDEKAVSEQHLDAVRNKINSHNHRVLKSIRQAEAAILSLKRQK